MMKRILPPLVCVLVLPGAILRAQDTGPEDEGAVSARKSGTLFKSEIDGLIRALRRGEGPSPERGSLGGDSVRATAMILTAMGHCHRRYQAGDGPVVQPSLQALFRGRQADGSFAEGENDAVRLTTAWVAAALQVMDPETYAEEIRTCKRWLRDHGHEELQDVWKREVGAVLDRVRPGHYPQHIGADAAEVARSLPMAADGIDRRAAAEALVTLVACQVANEELDQSEQSAAVAWSAAQEKGFDWLMERQEKGVFSVPTPMGSFADPGITAMGLSALQTKPVDLRTDEEQEVIEQGLDWLLAQQNPDGSFGRETVNYVTSAAVMALSKWGHPKVEEPLGKAQGYILAIQNIEDRGYQPGDRDYGSIGYGGDERGDLSNLQFAIQALRESGLEADHEAFAKALVFLQRTQNLRSHNRFETKIRDEDGSLQKVVPGDDGGAAYYPGNSPAGYIELPDGSRIARSYGSMTYALLKSYTLAGVEKDDPRVQAAVDWIAENWTLVENPGADPALGEKVKYQGLFYYYMVMAQALDTVGMKQVRVPAGDGEPAAVIPWRKALREHLEKTQRPDGSWLNTENDRWYEGLDLICTCYAMLALGRC